MAESTIWLPRCGYQILRVDFQKLRVYQAAERLVKGVDELIPTISAKFQKDIRQLDGAAGSVPFNIAEACGVETPGRMIYHLQIARGSADETRAVLRRLVNRGAITSIKAVPLMVLARTIAKMLTALIKSIEGNNKES